MSNKKKLVVLDDAGINDITQLSMPLADPTQTTLQGMAPIQMWNPTDPIMPDVGDVDAKILAAGGKSNTILVSTTTADVLATITVSIGPNGNWWVGATDTGVAAQGTDLTKVLRPTGLYVRPPLIFDKNTMRLTIGAGGAFCILDPTGTNVAQFTSTHETVVTVNPTTKVVGIDVNGNVQQITDTTDPNLGFTILPIAYFEQNSVVMTPAPTFSELLYQLTDISQELAQAIQAIQTEAQNQINIIANAAGDEITKITQAGQTAASDAQQAITQAEAEALQKINDGASDAVSEELEKRNIFLPNLYDLSDTIAQNREMYIAAGYVEPGKHGANNVNQGLWVTDTDEQTVFLGGGTLGTSKTPEAVMHFAGLLYYITTSFVFPDAPDTEVMADRHDVFGIELERIVLTDKVYPDGDLTKAPLDWTTIDQLAFAQQPRNRVYQVAKGVTVQYCWRPRVIAGTKRGMWANIDPTNGALRCEAGVIVDGYDSNDELGMFNKSSDDKYFYVCGIVPRLSNSMCTPENGTGAATGSDGLPWSSTANRPANKSECFTKRSGGNYQSGKSGRADGRYYNLIYTEGQGGIIPVRTTAKDASSKELAAQVFQSVINGTYRGKEVLTQTVFVGANDADGAVNNSIWFKPDAFPKGRNALDIPIGTPVGGIRADGTGYVLGYKSAHNGTASISVRPVDGGTVVRSSNLYLVQFRTNYCVSGEFTMIDVVGDPAEILATPVLTNGWLGGWIPKVPDGVENQLYQYTRKVLGTTVGADVFTSDNGANWQTGSFNANFNRVLNGRNNWRAEVGTVYVIPYTAFAKQTVESTNKPILNYHEGIGDVYANSFHEATHGCLLNESLISKVNTSASGRMRQFMKMDEVYTDAGKLYGTSVYQSGNSHAPIALDAPTNNSPAVKALWYQTATKGKVGLNFLYNEIKYKTGAVNPWGDTVAGTDYSSPHGQVRIINDQSTYTNLNGATCLCGTAELALHYGYVSPSKVPVEPAPYVTPTPSGGGYYQPILPPTI